MLISELKSVLSLNNSISSVIRTSSGEIKGQLLEKLIPNLNKKGLRGGVIYHDGQFDDSRMAITLALSANSKKTALLNYCNVDGLIKKNKEIVGLSFTDSINSKKYQVKS